MQCFEPYVVVQVYGTLSLPKRDHDHDVVRYTRERQQQKVVELRVGMAELAAFSVFASNTDSRLCQTTTMLKKNKVMPLRYYCLPKRKQLLQSGCLVLQKIAFCLLPAVVNITSQCCGHPWRVEMHLPLYGRGMPFMSMTSIITIFPR
jgi:hypothetical protein